MRDARASQRRHIELVPTPQRQAVSQRETLEQRRNPGDQAPLEMRAEGILALGDPIIGGQEVTRINEVAVKDPRRRPQVVAGAEVLPEAISAFDPVTVLNVRS